jgi:IS30 family transposase
LLIYSNNELQLAVDWINNRPLKVLNWLTPKEALEKELEKFP